MRELDRKIVRDVHMRGQFVAVGLVVVCGVASYVSMVSTYRHDEECVFPSDLSVAILLSWSP